MRALIAHPGPSQSVADVFNGWAKGLTQVGVNVGRFNLDERLAFYASVQMERDGELRRALDTEAAVGMTLKGLEAACYEFWPEVVILVSGFFLDEKVCELIRKRGHKLVLLHTESPYEDDRQIDMAQLADLNIINDPTNLDRFREVAPTVYLPHCYDPDIHYPRDPEPELASEFCFVGTGYPSRMEFFEQVDFTGVDVKLAGNWQNVTDDSPLTPFLTDERGHCCDNQLTARRYASTLTSCNLYRLEADRPELSAGWACTPREIELAAIGCWFARNPRGESDALFPMLPTFTSPAELGEQIRWALAHPDERYDATVKAYAAISDRTFDRNAAEMLNLL